MAEKTRVQKNRYAKLILTEADFPDDRKELIDGISQLIAATLGSIAEVEIPGVSLSLGEILRLEKLALTTEKTDYQSAVEKMQLVSLRRKLATIDITIPKGNRGNSPESQLSREIRESLSRLLSENLPAAFYLGPIRKILGSDSYFFDRKLFEKKTIPELKIITSNLVQLLRGDIAVISKFIEKHEIHATPSDLIILSTLYSQLRGYTSPNRLYVALYTPFMEDRVADRTLNTQIFDANLVFSHAGGSITNVPGRGWYINTQSRAIIDAYASEPDAAPGYSFPRPFLAKSVA